MKRPSVNYTIALPEGSFKQFFKENNLIVSVAEAMQFTVLCHPQRVPFARREREGQYWRVCLSLDDVIATDDAEYLLTSWICACAYDLSEIRSHYNNASNDPEIDIVSYTRHLKS